MLKQQRQDLISRELKSRNFISIEEAMALTDSSRSTIRRDMSEMEEDGRIIRIRGGASSAAPPPATNYGPEPAFVVQLVGCSRDALFFVQIEITAYCEGRLRSVVRDRKRSSGRSASTDPDDTAVFLHFAHIPADRGAGAFGQRHCFFYTYEVSCP